MNKAIQESPSVASIERFLAEFSQNPKAEVQDRALSQLFLKTYPSNSDIDEITIKVSSLNTLYSTQLRNHLFPVVQHIQSLGIDKRLKDGDLTLIDDLIATPLENGRLFRCYSFATKYCSFHNPEVYPIYDSYVYKVLVRLQQKDKFAGDMVLNNRDYSSYCEAISVFRKFYGLTGYSLKQVDKYLWHLGYGLVR